MTETDAVIRGVRWHETLPVLRLFRTFGNALNPTRVVIAFVALTATYLSGRVLDAIWLAGGGGVPVVVSTMPSAPAADARITGINAYASRALDTYAAWEQRARALFDERAAALKEDPGRERLTEARTRLTELGRTLATFEAATPEMRRDFDAVRLALEGGPRASVSAASDALAGLLVLSDDARRADDRSLFQVVLAHQTAALAHARSAPIGPFAALLEHIQQVVARSMRGVLRGNLAFANEGEPSLAAGFGEMLRAKQWLFSQRPLYATIWSLIHLIVWAWAGGAICRHASVQICRDMVLPRKDASRFAREKLRELVLAPLFVPILLAAGMLVLVLGGLIAAIPWLGELVLGLLMGLGLVLAFAMALAAILSMLATSLMWPVIAVEGSDAFDAVSRSIAYVMQKPWHLGAYAVLLFAYGAVCFTFLRLLAFVLLKLFHSGISAGMGWVTSANMFSIGKLDAMWHMPEWGELTVVPGTAPTPFWGSFYNAPLSGTESVAALLIAFWCFVIVGIVAAIGINFFYCGMVQIYLLLRRHQDGTDFDELYFEGGPDLDEDEQPDDDEGGVALPIAGQSG